MANVRLFPQIDQLADEAVITLAGRAVAVELVLGALFYADGGPVLIRFFGIITHCSHLSSNRLDITIHCE